MAVLNYACMAAVCCAVLILFEVRIRKLREGIPEKRAFQSLLLTGIIFCLVDALWGVGYVSAQSGNLLFFNIIAYCYFIASIVMSFAWFRYFAGVVGFWEKKIAKLYIIVSTAVQALFLVTNPFTHRVFKVSVTGDYIVNEARSAIFILQILSFFVIILISAGYYVKYTDTEKAQRIKVCFYSVFIFPITNLIAWIIPDSPMYSCGCMLTCVALYSFFIMDLVENKSN